MRFITAAVCSLVLVGAAGCDIPDLCDNSLITEAFSQDHLLVARTYTRSCGATTGPSTIVNLQRSSKKADASDEVLLLVEGKHDVVLHWTNPRALNITCRSCSRGLVFRQVTVVGKVDITYSFDVTQR